MAHTIVYLDIETTSGAIGWMGGPGNSNYVPVEGWEIISIQWQEIEAHTGKELFPLKILKRWESGSELDFLKKVFVGMLPVEYTFEFFDEKDGETKESNIKKVPNFLFYSNPPVLGYNLKFEQEVLEGKMKQWKDKIKYKNNRPEIIYSWNIDLMNFAAMRSGRTIDYKHNEIEFDKKGGTFRGSRLQNISCKDQSGDVIQNMYDNEDWKGIENYINKETKCAIETYKQLLEHMKDWNYKEIN